MTRPVMVPGIVSSPWPGPGRRSSPSRTGSSPPPPQTPSSRTFGLPDALVKDEKENHIFSFHLAQKLYILKQMGNWMLCPLQEDRVIQFKDINALKKKKKVEKSLTLMHLSLRKFLWFCGLWINKYSPLSYLQLVRLIHSHLEEKMQTVGQTCALLGGPIASILVKTSLLQ